MRDVSFQITPLIFHFALNVQLIGPATGALRLYLRSRAVTMVCVFTVTSHITFY